MGGQKDRKPEKEESAESAENYIIEMLFALARMAVKSGHHQLGIRLHEQWLSITRERDRFRKNMLGIVRDFGRETETKHPLTYVAIALIAAAEVLRNETLGLTKDGPDSYARHAEEIEKIARRVGDIGGTLGVLAWGLPEMVNKPDCRS